MVRKITLLILILATLVCGTYISIKYMENNNNKKEIISNPEDKVVTAAVIEKEKYVDNEITLESINREDEYVFLDTLFSNLDYLMTLDAFESEIFIYEGKNDWIEKTKKISEIVGVNKFYPIDITILDEMPDSKKKDEEIKKTEAVGIVSYSIFGNNIDSQPYPVYEIFYLSKKDEKWYINTTIDPYESKKELIIQYHIENQLEFDSYLAELYHFENMYPSISDIIKESQLHDDKLKNILEEDVSKE